MGRFIGLLSQIFGTQTNAAIKQAVNATAAESKQNRGNKQSKFLHRELLWSGN